MASVTDSVTGERGISDECDGCVDVSSTSNKSQSSSVGLLEKVLVSEAPKIEVEKTETDPSHSSQSTPVKVTEDSQPVTNSSQNDEELVDWDEIIEGIDKEMSRLGWGVQQGQRYILEKYGKKSRQVLSDVQLLEFLEYLKEQPKFKVGQTAIFRGTKVIIERLINQFVAVVRSYEHPKEKSMEVSMKHLSLAV